jgi:hypothetical protein
MREPHPWRNPAGCWVPCLKVLDRTPWTVEVKELGLLHMVQSQGARYLKIPAPHREALWRCVDTQDQSMKKGHRQEGTKA